MVSFIARSERFTAVFSAEDAEKATDVLCGLFRAAGEPLEEMEVLQFDPSVEGGILWRNDEVKS